ncbi:MAG: hypothetical protein JSS28_11180 [Proteobacteria bacterium]|nr:hypothetical protein [Pseudomonadota bacterium]
MRVFFLFVLGMALTACQTLTPQASRAAGNALERLDSALAGDWDNHEQVKDSASGANAGTAVAIPRLRESLHRVDSRRDGSLWWWQLESGDAKAQAKALWLFLITPTGSDDRVALTPYRALDPVAAEAMFAGKQKFRFDAAQWAELAACAQTGAWDGSRFSAHADSAACSALLPGLGASAGLLPLRIALDGDMLHSTTFADQARGEQARIDARRVRWFTGWAAINGGGPRARAGNQDWHMQKDLRLSSEGGRIELRWRDGAASGYTLELERVTYPERKLHVLQLNVIEDASGQTLDYVWADPVARAAGFNLGWLQVGLNETEPDKP